MAIAKVFKSGNSQALRLAKQFRLDSVEVEIFRRGDEIVLREKSRKMARAFKILSDLDFTLDRKDTPSQTRKGLRWRVICWTPISAFTSARNAPKPS